VVSAGEIDIRPESLAAAGKSLALTTEQMADAVKHLQEAVTGPGNPWGNDETGTLFGGVYTMVLGHALESLSSYVEQVGYAASALMVQAREAVATDESAAGRVSDAGHGL
jgi:hypothetical protein